MDTEIVTKFRKMGARARVTVVPQWATSPQRSGGLWSTVRPVGPVTVDIRRDDAGEYFDLRRRPDVDVQVLDVRPADRHLLLMTRQRDDRDPDARSRFLCGHDERSWFVAAVPEAARAANVQAAKDALKPREVWDAIRAHGVPRKHRDRRRTSAFIRQGEWFFIPRPRLNVDQKLVLCNEPIRRGRGKPHQCQFLYRVGGEQVYVCPAYPNGLALAQYRELSPAERDRHRWQPMVRDARVFAKGAVRHPDHKSVWLGCWHQVLMNTETRARAMQNVAFLD